MKMNQHDRITNFFSGQFHHDWADSAEHPSEVLDEYLSRVGVEEADRLVKDLEDFLSAAPGPEQARQVAAGAFVDPSVEEMSHLEWIGWVCEYVRTQLNA